MFKTPIITLLGPRGFQGVAGAKLPLPLEIPRGALVMMQ
jgi:hypothetical protein